MNELENIKQEIQKLKERNKRVEASKAWEISLTRKVLLMLIIYLIVAFTLIVIYNDSPWINALIPTLGFYFSTLTLPFIKKLWEKYFYRK